MTENTDTTPGAKDLQGLNYLAQHALWDGSREFSLDIPTRLCRELGNPQDSCNTVHVAGTNGKGSVCAILSAIFRAAGFRTGQFTSPHLCDPTERCLIDSLPCAEACFDSALLEVKAAAERCGVDPSYFEISAAASFVEFKRSEVDWAVVEVGLGGRLDATNVIKRPQASVITSIAFDHTHVLGDTLALIAAEKAGIIKAGVPAFAGKLEPEAFDVIAETADRVGSPLIRVEDRDRELVVSSKLALRGAHQQDNAALAVRVARHLSIVESDIKTGLRCVRWPARLEYFAPKSENCAAVLLDAAHNQAGVESALRYLAELLEKRSALSSIVFVVAALERKDWGEMARQLTAFRAQSSAEVEFVATTCGSKASVPTEQLAEKLDGAQQIGNPVEALQSARQRGSATLCVVIGSCYLAGAVRPSLCGKAFSTWDESECSNPVYKA